ncbi:hypothetical protein OSW16_13710 [Pseudomonas putida]|uniref:hypothetical protein n=1 Tax=Pseudomonas putida TaxID=303 RepID=UPI0022705269|nr:hypothetical protein [Pseudomonas putida]WAB95626.1 hypothetical protein OSW16_13650 [Pseudomonas putida]WAB95637.1 hypothetical protein OSW16_13710 [Pseudomonas putida]
MITVRFDGARLTASDRRNIEFRKSLEASRKNSVLQQSVEQTIQALETRKEQAVKPERIWVLEYEAKGTLCIAEWMGY